MSTFDINKWYDSIQEIKQDLNVYQNIINEELYSDISDREVVDNNNKTLSGLNKKGIDRNSFDDMMKVLSYFDNMTALLKENVDIITKEKYIKSIERSMSETYYKDILSKNKGLHKKIDKLYGNINTYVKIVVSSLSEEDINRYKWDDIIKAYTPNISDSTTKIFMKVLRLYKVKNINIIGIINELKNSSLGYKGELFSKDPYCKHPLLLMGMTFNLYPIQSNTFIDKSDINTTNTGAILIDNSLHNSTNITIYDLKKILYGSYGDISRIHSINKNFIEASKTIIMKPVSVDKNKGIIIDNKGKEKTIIYESLDGKTYRKMGPIMDTSAANNISIGPKPRVYLYNSLSYDTIKGKKDIFLNKEVEVRTEYIDLLKYKGLKTIPDVLKLMGITKDGNKDKYLYYVFIASRFLNEIRKLNTRKNIKEYKIAVEKFLVSELF